MVTATEDLTIVGGPKPYRMTVGQYHAMIDARIFPAEARVELLAGIVVQKMTKYPPHNFGVYRLSELLRAMLPEGVQLREEKPISLDDWSQPEPDIVVARGDSTAFRSREPGPRDILLIVEVAESSYSYDRGEKWRHYAAAGIPCYVILNLGHRQLEVYTSPQGRDDLAVYRETAVIDDKSEWPARVEERDLGRIAVRDLLP